MVNILVSVSQIKGIVSWDIDGIFMILSNSLDGRQLPLDILFILILCFHILILILMLARCAPAFPEKVAQFG
jgi:hypothetical protein